MSNVVIHAKNVSKEYRLGTIGHGTLYRDLQSGWAKFRKSEDPNAKIDSMNLCPVKNTNDRFYALNDISFDIEQGTVVGIIGRNGAGKSTLLKIISRVTAPTKGSIKIKGRVASLLEVGTGFHPELTGRENVFLNGAILGMHKGEIEQKFDDIVKFAEINKFIDTPVKRYSSGMYVRLAFAVAAHLEPEILVVDEVLAVGDSAFQKKCLGKMGSVAKEGRTVLFVSHNMTAVKALCARGILLDDGKIQFDGEASDAIDCYLKKNEENIRVPIAERKRDRIVSFRAKIIDIDIISRKGNCQTKLDSTEPLEIVMAIQVYSRMFLSGRFEITNKYGPLLYFCSSHQQNYETEFEPGIHHISCYVSPTYLSAGKYSINCGLISGKNTEWVDSVEDAYRFVIDYLDIYDSGFNLTQNNAVYHVDHEWKID